MQPKAMIRPQPGIGVNMEKLKTSTSNISLLRMLSNEEDQAKRMAEVEASIKSSNKYDMTADELEFGSRTAWRNAPRCIGRIQWSKLKFFDGRDVKSTKDMFDKIVSK
ncbi:NOS1 [Bugula neritina]|uniref:nitric-oxide synthase (NADPH) n=1 Tax=Bugula neritina TaxID=10212 RepID=A0A7J7K429_BUGNE|nr:NOS1 [Bugula neritina]